MPLDFTTALFARDPLLFLSAKAINPPAQESPSLTQEKAIPLNDRNLHFFSQASKIEIESLQARFKSAQVEVPIAWIRLFSDFRFPGACTFDLEFASGDVGARIDRADRLPVYYLPWEPEKFVRMTIPAYRPDRPGKLADFGIGRDHSGKTFLIDAYNPHLFFTAGLTGCSVFVYGDPREPTITHVGTRTDTPYGDECALFWRELLHLERVQRQRDKGLASEVNVEQYQGRAFGKTRSISEFRRWLATRPEKFTIEEIIPYGAVFGIRYGSLWSFYIQECGFVDVYKVVQQNRRRLETVSPDFSLPEPMWYGDKLIEVYETVTVQKKCSKTIPFSVRPFFPKGGGSAKLRWAFTSRQEGYFR